MTRYLALAVLAVVLAGCATTVPATAPTTTAGGSDISRNNIPPDVTSPSVAGPLPVGDSNFPMPTAGTCHVGDRGGQPPACTPGAINPDVTPATLDVTICKAGWTATIRPPVSVTNRWKSLWPEPGKIPNAKDPVENKLKAAVCAHRIGLAAAQQAIAGDWTTALQRLGL